MKAARIALGALPALLLALVLVGCGGATARPSGHEGPGGCPPCSEAPVPSEDVDLQQLQAILSDQGLEVRAVGKAEAGGPRVLVVQGDPKVVLSVNARREDVEMAVIYGLKATPDDATFRRLNALNQKLPCQTSTTDTGQLLLESYFAYDGGLHVAAFVAAVKKFQRYGMFCVVQMQDLVR